MGFEGGGGSCQKNMASKAGRRKKLGVKGESLKNSFNFCSYGVGDNAKSLPESQKPALLTFKNKFRFSRGKYFIFYIIFS